MTKRVVGAVLAGGASSRFGSDKAMAVVDGRTLLDHTRAVLAAVVNEVVVVGRGEIADLPCSGLGPLGGIAGALDHARRQGFDSVVTIGCDMPVVPGGLLEALLALAPCYCADAPVLGHWPTSQAASLVERLAPPGPSPRPCAGVHQAARASATALAEPWIPAQGRDDETWVERGRHSRDPALSIRRWAIDIGALAIPSPTPIANINTPADLAAL